MSKKAKFQPAPEVPDRADVYNLFDELLPNEYRRRDCFDEHPEIQEIDELIKERQEELKYDSKLLRLQKRRDETIFRIRIALTRSMKAAKKVRREFLAKGLTPMVAKKLASLVDLVNSREV